MGKILSGFSEEKKIDRLQFHFMKAVLINIDLLLANENYS